MRVKNIVLRARPISMALPNPSSIPRSVSLLTRKEDCDGDGGNYSSETDGVNVTTDSGTERCFADAQKAPSGDIFGGYVMEVDSLEEETCIRCNGGGEVLFCCETGCPIALHEKCVGSEPILDAMGKFYCPYCLYKRAVARTRELREKAMEAKKELSSFLDPKVVGSDKGDGKGKQTNVDTPDTSRFHGNRNHLDHENIPDNDTNEETNVDGSLNTSTKQAKDNAKVFPCRNKEHIQLQIQENFVLPRRVGPERRAKQRTKNTVQPLNVYLPSKLATQLEYMPEGNGQSKKEWPITSQESRDRFIGGKRKRMLWTAEEEEMIKKGVNTFSRNINKNIPWRKILELGRDVFHPSRYPADLKDKWKTMNKEL